MKMKFEVEWDWFDFGIMFIIFRPDPAAEYNMIIDIQFAWLNIWVKCFFKKGILKREGGKLEFFKKIIDMTESKKDKLKFLSQWRKDSCLTRAGGYEEYNNINLNEFIKWIDNEIFKIKGEKV